MIKVFKPSVTFQAYTVHSAPTTVSKIFQPIEQPTYQPTSLQVLTLPLDRRWDHWHHAGNYLLLDYIYSHIIQIFSVWLYIVLSSLVFILWPYHIVCGFTSFTYSVPHISTPSLLIYSYISPITCVYILYSSLICAFSRFCIICSSLQVYFLIYHQYRVVCLTSLIYPEFQSERSLKSLGSNNHSVTNTFIPTGSRVHYLLVLPNHCSLYSTNKSIPTISLRFFATPLNVLSRTLSQISKIQFSSHQQLSSLRVPRRPPQPRWSNASNQRATFA